MGFSLKRTFNNVKRVVKDAVPVVAGAASGFLAGGPVGAVVGAAAGLGTLIQDGKNEKKVKEAREQQTRALNSQMDVVKDSIRRFDELRDNLPAQTKDFMEAISDAYAENRILLDQAKKEGDEIAAANFAAMGDMIETSMASELAAVGENHQQYIDLLDGMMEDTVALVQYDEEANDALREAYKKESQGSMDSLNKVSGLLGDRLDGLQQSGGLPEGSAAILSNMRQGVADVQRKVAALDSATGKGGSGSRKSAVALEGIKDIASTSAALREQGKNELLQLTTATQQNAAATGNLAGQRLAMLEETEGRQIAEAKAPFLQQQAAAEDRRGAQELTALTNANTQKRVLQADQGDFELAQNEQYSRDRMSLALSQTAAEQKVKEREQDLMGQYTARTVSANNSMADVLGVQANNYANQAKEAQAQRGAFMSSVMQLGVGALAGAHRGEGAMSGMIEYGLGVPMGGSSSGGSNVSKNFGTMKNFIGNAVTGFGGGSLSGGFGA